MLSRKLINEKLPFISNQLNNNNNIFYDKSVQYFKIIVEYLIGYKIDWELLSDNTLINLRKDALFFDIQDLVKEIDNVYITYSEDEKNKIVNEKFNILLLLNNFCKNGYFDIIKNQFGNDTLVSGIIDSFGYWIDTFLEDDSLTTIYKKLIKEFIYPYRQNSETQQSYELLIQFISQYIIKYYSFYINGNHSKMKYNNDSNNKDSNNKDSNNKYFDKNVEDEINKIAKMYFKEPDDVEEDVLPLFNVRECFNKKVSDKIVKESFNEIKNNKFNKKIEIECNNCFDDTVKVMKDVIKTVDIQNIINKIDTFLGNF